MYEWLYQGLAKFSPTDYAVVLIMFFTVAYINIPAGVILGVMITGVIFIIRYSKTNVVRTVLTGKNFQSNVDRPLRHANYLKEIGEQLLILRLDGFVFFGTAYAIYKQVKTRLDHQINLPITHLIIDFSLTSGVDSSAAMVFNKMKNLSARYSFELIFCSLNEYVQKKLERNGFSLTGGRFHVMENIDHATEWCEDSMLNLSSMTILTPSSLTGNWGDVFSANEFSRMLSYMQPIKVTAGETLLTQGEEMPRLYLVERGQVTVYRELGNGTRIRLRRMGAGTTVGEMSLYMGNKASATVIADVPSKLYLLGDDGLKKLEVEDPELAAKFHRHIVNVLGQRLQNMNASLQALLE